MNSCTKCVNICKLGEFAIADEEDYGIDLNNDTEIYKGYIDAVNDKKIWLFYASAYYECSECCAMYKLHLPRHDTSKKLNNEMTERALVWKYRVQKSSYDDDNGYVHKGKPTKEETFSYTPTGPKNTRNGRDKVDFEINKRIKKMKREQTNEFSSIFTNTAFFKPGNYSAHDLITPIRDLLNLKSVDDKGLVSAEERQYLVEEKLNGCHGYFDARFVPVTYVVDKYFAERKFNSNMSLNDYIRLTTGNRHSTFNNTFNSEAYYVKHRLGGELKKKTQALNEYIYAIDEDSTSPQELVIIARLVSRGNINLFHYYMYPNLCEFAIRIKCLQAINACAHDRQVDRTTSLKNPIYDGLVVRFEGELYIPGYTRYQISGIVGRKEYDTNPHDRLGLYIFDVDVMGGVGAIKRRLMIDSVLETDFVENQHVFAPPLLGIDISVECIGQHLIDLNAAKAEGIVIKFNKQLPVSGVGAFKFKFKKDDNFYCYEHEWSGDKYNRNLKLSFITNDGFRRKFHVSYALTDTELDSLLKKDLCGTNTISKKSYNLTFNEMSDNGIPCHVTVSPID